MPVDVTDSPLPLFTLSNSHSFQTQSIKTNLIEVTTTQPQLSHHQQDTIIMLPTTTSKLPCMHTYLRQTILTQSLPPLYIATSAPSNASSSQTNILPRLTTQLTHIHAYLGRRQSRSPFLAHNIVLLQQELEKGMSRERREEVEIYVNGIEDPWKKAATELYLARYPGFVMGWDGRLDFGTRELREEVVEDRGKERGCVIM